MCTSGKRLAAAMITVLVLVGVNALIVLSGEADGFYGHFFKSDASAYLACGQPSPPRAGGQQALPVESPVVAGNSMARQTARNMKAGSCSIGGNEDEADLGVQSPGEPAIYL